MKRWILALGIMAALAGCGTPEAPATLATDEPADSAALVARPTVTAAPPAPSSTPFPTEPPTDEPPTAEPAATEIVPPTAALIQIAGADPATWVAYRNEQYGFSFSYPPCLGEVFEEPAYARPAGLYTEGYNRKTSRMITTTLNLDGGPVSPDCVAQTMSVLVWELEGYSNYNVYSELTYDAATDSWLRNDGHGPEPDDFELVEGEGWRGQHIGFGDAEILITGLAVPHEARNLVIEISFGYRFSQDGPADQGIDSAAIKQILQSLRLTP
ncbi:MAG TPA: lipoprotein [Herpetosiphonaceae bacterium]|nr:lipoprotein [Herpetosiphonaceae bacterium]